MGWVLPPKGTLAPSHNFRASEVSYTRAAQFLRDMSRGTVEDFVSKHRLYVVTVGACDAFFSPPGYVYVERCSPDEVTSGITRVIVCKAHQQSLERVQQALTACGSASTILGALLKTEFLGVSQEPLAPVAPAAPAAAAEDATAVTGAS